MNFTAGSAMKCFASRCGASALNALTVSCSAWMLELLPHIQLPSRPFWYAPQ
jgi:hypothetical protein